MDNCCYTNKKADKSAQLLKVLSERNRLRILCVLLHKEICVCKLARKLNLAQNLVSHHLKILHDNGVLDKKRNRNQLFYFIKKNKEKDLRRLFEFLNLK